MGNCLKRRDSSELPKPPVRQLSNGEAKVKIVQDVASIHPPTATEQDQSVCDPIPTPVSQTQLQIVSVNLLKLMEFSSMTLYLSRLTDLLPVNSRGAP